MGIDIDFHVEVRNQEEWVRLHFIPPFVTEAERDARFWNTGCYVCRYHNFRDFLEVAASHVSGGSKGRFSKDIAAHLDGVLGYGTFMFEDLVAYCEKEEEKLLERLDGAGLFLMKRQLDRMESSIGLFLKAAGVRDGSADAGAGDEPFRSASEIYEDFLDRHYCVRFLCGIVRGVIAVCSPYVQESDVRIFYRIC